MVPRMCAMSRRIYSLRIALFMLLYIVVTASASSEVYVELRPGQEWSYEIRSQDVGSTVVMGRIEDHPKLGMIVHAIVRNVIFSQEISGEGSVQTIRHVPVAEISFRESLVALVSESVNTRQIREGIGVWRESKRGVFDISLREIVQVVEDAQASPNKLIRN